jgi:predicted Zn-dependent peptidase
MSHYLEHMFFKGTLKRPEARDISDAIESVGGIMNASTDHEDMVLWTKVPQSHSDLAIDVLLDMLQNSTLNHDEMEKERMVILEEINMVYDTPSQRVFQLMGELLYPNHPLGRDVAGTVESVQAINRELLASYLSNQYTPINTVISVAGNINHHEIVKMVEEALGDWESSQPAGLTVFTPREVDLSVHVEYRKTEQAHICLGMQGFANNDPRRFASDLLISILGDGMSSRLFLELRENQGLVYDVSASGTHYQDCGSIIFYAASDPRKSSRTLTALLQELARATKDITEHEVKRIKELIKGRMLLRMEDSRNVAAWYGGQELLQKTVLSPEEIFAHYDAVSLTDINNIARTLFRPENYHLAVFGPFRKDTQFKNIMQNQ